MMPMPTPNAYPRSQIRRDSDAASAWDALVEKTPASEAVLAKLRAPMPALLVGFDGSLTAFGWSVVTIEDRPRVLRVGCITTKPDTKSKHVYQADKDGARVDEIADGLLDALDEALAHGVPVLVAIEAPAGAQHAASAKALGLSYGVSRAVCRARKVTPITVQAHEVKSVTGGTKGASKDEVAAGVTRLTGWSSSAKTAPAREGEADAVGVALTAMRHPIASALRVREITPPSAPAMTAPAPAARPRGEEREPAVLARAGVAGSPEVSRIPGVTSDGASLVPAHAGSRQSTLEVESPRHEGAGGI